MNPHASHHVVFGLDGQRFALPLEVVERVVRAVEITFLPNAPVHILGIVDLGDRVVPVLNLRQCLGLPSRELRLSDHLLIAQSGQRSVALLIDHVQEVVQSPNHEMLDTSWIAVSPGPVAEIFRLGDGLVLIQDLAHFHGVDETAISESLSNWEPGNEH